VDAINLIGGHVFQAIIWDFDGTLMDTYPAIGRAVNLALAAFDITVPLERIIELSSISLDYCIRELAQAHDLSYDQLDTQFTHAYQTVTPEEQPPFPDVIAVCQALLRSDGRNFIVTHRRRASLHRLLNTHQMSAYFADIVAGDDGFPRKPDPQGLLYLMQRHSLAPQHTLVIGDRDLDILAGQQAGVKTCLFRSAFPNLSPDLHIQRFQELLVILAATASVGMAAASANSH
jgi:HAD superfamily hydrolase (TIGR01509 family)